MEQINFTGKNIEMAGMAASQPDEIQPSLGNTHAQKTWLRLYQEACDQWRRAERDLHETAIFVASSLTTVSTVQAVITIANERLGISQEILRKGFAGYLAIFLAILVYGYFHGRHALQKRTQAEEDIDLAKKGIYKYCPIEQWPKFEE